MNTTSSAKPEDLFRYARICGQNNQDLAAYSPRLRSALQHFEQRCSEPAFKLTVSYHGDSLRSYCNYCTPKDDQVRQVGERFRLADIVWTFFSVFAPPPAAQFLSVTRLLSGVISQKTINLLPIPEWLNARANKAFSSWGFLVTNHQSRQSIVVPKQEEIVKPEPGFTRTGPPREVGTKGLHGVAGEANSRDYRSSLDFGAHAEDRQRARIPSREVFGFGKGRIDYISFSDGSRTSPGNDGGITMQVYYPDTGYTVQYSHIIPSTQILREVGISESEIHTTAAKISKNIWIDEGEIIGHYNQIGDSSEPHLHLAVWFGERIKGKAKPLDPEETGIPQQTLR